MFYVLSGPQCLLSLHFFTTGPLISFRYSVCEGQILYAGIDKSAISLRIQDLSANLTWFDQKAAVAAAHVTTATWSYR